VSYIDHTHDPALTSWVASANTPDSDFPIQNLPFGRFRVANDPEWRIGVAIGDQVLDVCQAALVPDSDMNRLMDLSASERITLRRALSVGLRSGSDRASAWQEALHSIARVELGVPCRVGDYTDFYVGIHHATAVGKLFRPDAPLLPNYKWVPIGYHGRSSTLLPSGQPFHRPRGQIKATPGADPILVPTRRLDFELEVGMFIGRGNPIGQPITLDKAEQHLFGIVLFNDWSARDIQAWEYQPLGPFLSKNFASTISPWIVTMEALAPFRLPFARASGEPRPLPYLDGEQNTLTGAVDIQLEVHMRTESMRNAGLSAQRISTSNFATSAYWTPAQLVTHHTVNGCSLSSGDLLGSGTLSGEQPEQAGSLLELTEGGRRAIELPNGETRTFIEDGDSIQLIGRCSRDGFRSIGFGPCDATVLAAH
jgi:fumarylacetoacetase